MADLPIGRVTIRDREQAGLTGGRLTLGGEVVSLDELTRRARAEGAREEREAVARWLNALGFKDLAGDFEAGEHRKEADRG